MTDQRNDFSSSALWKEDGRKPSLAQRISDALDAHGVFRPDEKLAAEIETNADAKAYLLDLQALDAQLNSLPLPERSEMDWEKLAARMDNAVDAALNLDFDPNAPFVERSSPGASSRSELSALTNLFEANLFDEHELSSGERKLPEPADSHFAKSNAAESISFAASPSGLPVSRSVPPQEAPRSIFEKVEKRSSKSSAKTILVLFSSGLAAAAVLVLALKSSPDRKVFEEVSARSAPSDQAALQEEAPEERDSFEAYRANEAPAVAAPSAAAPPVAAPFGAGRVAAGGRLEDSIGGLGDNSAQRRIQAEPEQSLDLERMRNAQRPMATERSIVTERSTVTERREATSPTLADGTRSAATPSTWGVREQSAVDDGNAPENNATGRGEGAASGLSGSLDQQLRGGAGATGSGSSLGALSQASPGTRSRESAEPAAPPAEAAAPAPRPRASSASEPARAARRAAPSPIVESADPWSVFLNSSRRAALARCLESSRTLRFAASDRGTVASVTAPGASSEEQGCLSRTVVGQALPGFDASTPRDRSVAVPVAERAVRAARPSDHAPASAPSN